MKRVLIGLLLAVGVAVFVEGIMIVAEKNVAECAYCPTYTCYSSSNCMSCTCIKQGLDVGGTCYSFERTQSLPDGYEILP